MDLRERIAHEADLVEDMAQFQAQGLASLRVRFVHSDFSDLVVRKREAMDRLARGREDMRPLTTAWIKARTDEGLTDPDLESELSRLKSAFDTVREVEDELEAMATAYLARTAEDPGQLDDRIRLHRSWT